MMPASRIELLTPLALADVVDGDMLAIDDVSADQAKSLTVENARALLGSGVISVKHPHGALGDGSTDDATAIQAAYDAAGVNDVVYFPPGKYKVTSTIFPKGVATVGSCRGWLPDAGGDFQTEILPVFPKGTQVNGTDIAFTASQITSGGVADLSVFADKDILYIEGATTNLAKVVTVNGTPSSTVINVNETSPSTLETESLGASMTITKITPVFEDGADVQSRVSPANGTSFTGMAIRGGGAGATWATLIDANSYVIGYHGGHFGDNTTHHNIRGAFDLRCSRIVAGVQLTGWQNTIHLFIERCPLGASLSFQNAGDVSVVCDGVGANRYSTTNGGRLFFANDSNTTLRTHEDQFDSLTSCNVQARIESADNAALTQALFTVCLGCKFQVYGTGVGTLTKNFFQVSNCDNCLFLGHVAQKVGGSSSEMAFDSASDQSPNLVNITGAVPTGTGAQRIVFTNGTADATTTVTGRTQMVIDGVLTWVMTGGAV